MVRQDDPPPRAAQRLVRGAGDDVRVREGRGVGAPCDEPASGFSVWSLEFEVYGLGVRGWGLGVGIEGLGFKVWGLGLGVSGFGLRVSAFACD